jgi:serine protease Do
VPRGLPIGLGTVPVPKLGFEFADLTAGLAKDLGYPEGVRGVLIARVEPGSLAADAALHSGMLIAQVDGKAVATTADARKMLEAASAQGVLLQVQSLEGGVTYVLLKAE